jgi:hypothetical protein
MERTATAPPLKKGFPLRSHIALTRPQSMHHCLKILEIVDMVCSHLEPSTLPWPTGTGDKRFHNLAVIARTCTTFKGPALDYLWRSTTLERLFTYCMPSDVWAIHTSHQSFGRTQCEMVRGGLGYTRYNGNLDLNQFRD